LLGAYAEIRRTPGAGFDVDSRRIGWLARRARDLQLATEGDLKKGRLNAKRDGGKTSDEAQVEQRVQLHFPTQQTLTDEEKFVQQMQQRQERKRNLQALIAENSTKAKTQTSSSMSTEKAYDSILAPGFSFDWMQGPEKVEGEDPDDLEVEIPEELLQKAGGRRNILHSSLQQQVSRKRVEQLRKEMEVDRAAAMESQVSSQQADDPDDAADSENRTPANDVAAKDLDQGQALESPERRLPESDDETYVVRKRRCRRVLDVDVDELDSEKQKRLPEQLDKPTQSAQEALAMDLNMSADGGGATLPALAPEAEAPAPAAPAASEAPAIPAPVPAPMLPAPAEVPVPAPDAETKAANSIAAGGMQSRASPQPQKAPSKQAKLSDLFKRPASRPQPPCETDAVDTIGVATVECDTCSSQASQSQSAVADDDTADRERESAAQTVPEEVIDIAVDEKEAAAPAVLEVGAPRLSRLRKAGTAASISLESLEEEAEDPPEDAVNKDEEEEQDRAGQFGEDSDQDSLEDEACDDDIDSLSDFEVVDEVPNEMMKESRRLRRERIFQQKEEARQYQRKLKFEIEDVEGLSSEAERARRLGTSTMTPEEYARWSQLVGSSAASSVSIRAANPDVARKTQAGMQTMRSKSSFLGQRQASLASSRSTPNMFGRAEPAKQATSSRRLYGAEAEGDKSDMFLYSASHVQRSSASIGVGGGQLFSVAPNLPVPPSYAAPGPATVPGLTIGRVRSRSRSCQRSKQPLASDGRALGRHRSDDS